MIPGYIIEYYGLIVFFFCSFFLSIILCLISYFIVQQDVYSEKVSAYECGFLPFDDARNQFNVRFYLVAILFLIFDLEVIFIFPWVITLFDTGFLGFYIMLIFLVLLLIGFMYEWQQNALEWE